MIFSNKKWEEEREGLEYLKISNACSWITVKAPVRNAWDLFIVPLIGEAMAETLTEIYLQDEQIENDKKLLRLAQRANILLAFWYDYAELNVLIGDSGFKRQESENTKTPYKYQEKQLRDGWKTKGFNALDDLLCFLETNISEYDDYRLSENYTQNRKAIIQNTEQVNSIYFINRSRLTYLRLKPHFKIVEDTILAPRLGELFIQLKEELEKENPDPKFIALRNVLQPVIIFHAVQRLLLETGDLSDKGLFFASLRNDDSDTQLQEVADERATCQAKQAEADAISYWKLAEKHLQVKFGIEPATGGIHHRDNNNRKAFWT
jgi:hypothetical protein